MLTKEDLQKRYESLSNSDLLEIIDNKHQYTDMAVSVALSELAKRNVDEEEIAKYKENQIIDFADTIDRNYIDDLSVWQKVFFFIFFIPIFHFAFKIGFRRDGYILKAQQANFYSITGFLSLLAINITIFSLGFNDTFIMLGWAAVFFATLYIDLNIRRKKRLEIFEQEPFKDVENNDYQDHA